LIPGPQALRKSGAAGPVQGVVNAVATFQVSNSDLKRHDPSRDCGA